MKQINYILPLLLCLFFFNSCEKEEFIPNNTDKIGGEYYINPEDTAGIVVPEGYSLVVFPGDKAMTRAVVGNDNRISHLQYIIYQKDGNGDYIQLDGNQKVNMSLSTWPLKAIAISLPKNNDYKVVFLGNVDKSIFGSNQNAEVLTGTGKGTNYNDARILLPRVEFTDLNMYYLGDNEFDTKNETSYVPVTLKRIVSRNDITKEGLSQVYAEEMKDKANKLSYIDAYWRQLIKEKLVTDIFTGENSAFSYQVAEGMKQQLIYPLIHIGLKTPEDATDLANNFGYTAVKKYSEEWGTKYKYTELQLTDFQTMRNKYKNDIENVDYANNMFIQYAQYLYNVFAEETSKDPAMLKKVLTQIYSDNLEIKENVGGGVTNVSLSIDAAIRKVIDAFNDNYSSNVLLPWKNIKDNGAGIIETSTPMPAALKLDLTPDEALQESVGNKCYAMKSPTDDTSDKYISVITLGELKESVNTLGINKISYAASKGNTIESIPTSKGELISTAFNAGYFHRNIKSVTTQSIETASLTDKKPDTTTDKYQQKIEISTYNLFYTCMGAKKVNGDIQIGSDVHSISITTINTPNTLNYIQNQILNIMADSKYPRLDLQSEKDISFPFVTFISPNVSPSNIDANVTTKWTVSTIEK